MKIFVLSLGQLINSDESRSKNAFIEIVQKEKNYNGFLAWLNVNFSLILDKIWYKTIDQYKIGAIEYKVFKNRICSQLGISESVEFDRAWKVMCEITDEVLDKIENIITAKDLHLVVVSLTNESQFEYIKEQINNRLSKKGLPILEENKCITFSCSHEKGILSLIELAKIEIGKSEYDKSRNEIIFLHNAFSNKNIALTQAKSQFVRIGPMEWVKKITDYMKKETYYEEDRDFDIVKSESPTQSLIHRRQNKRNSQDLEDL